MPLITPMNTVAELRAILAKPICFAELGEFNSLSLGFGSIKSYNERTKTPIADTELVTYHKSWRIIHKKKILISGLNLGGELKIKNKLETLINKEFISLKSFSPFDLEMESGSGFVIQLIALPDGIDKELAHVVSRSKDIVTTFYPGKGWKTGPYSSKQTSQNSLRCRFVKDLSEPQ
jgi:hypothetical protein